MTSFPFNTGVPAPNNNPSVDQPDLLSNNVSSDAILAVDHVSFNSAGSGGAGASGGQHLQVTFNDKHAAGVQVDPISTLYTGAGTASTNADLFFRNQDGIYRPNLIKAVGVFTGTTVAGPVAFTGVNVASITQVSSTSYTVALTAGAITGTTVIVFTSTSNVNRTVGWTYALNTLTLTTNAGSSTNGDRISFEILQV